MMDSFRDSCAAFQAPPTDPFLGGHAAMSMTVRSNVFVNLVNADRTKWTTAFAPRFVNFPHFPTPKIGAGMTGLERRRHHPVPP